MSTDSQSKLDLAVVLPVIIAILLASLAVYLFINNQKITEEKMQLQQENVVNINKFLEASSTIENLLETLEETTEKLSDAEKDLEKEQERNEEFEDQLRRLSGTVRDLDKLSKTDEELLQKYSRTYFLNENFIPMRLSKINNRYVMPDKKDLYFHGNGVKFLEDMLDDAKDAGFDIRIISAYRSFDEQTDLKGQYTQIYGSGSNTFSADQGYSEHQLGTTVDIVDMDTRTTSDSFANTEAYKWLVDNAYRYGFVLSYPENNAFYIFEPWHWRFVGVDLARDLHRADAQFYEWDQRKIDEYLIKVFD
ncbi:MAG: D-alanyl-D-alanine carboxypeptidase family protein [Candidatus Pacebacteria bacterium]|nr:D-alanyl-D-alanine carboxypeptidase family protein [Candidatus Paceibacterota bacterium]